MGRKDLFIQCCGEAVEEPSVFLGSDFFGKEIIKRLDVSEFRFRQESRQGLGDEGVVDLEKGVGEPRDGSGIFGEKPRKKGHEFRPAEALAKARICMDRGFCSSVRGPFPERFLGRFAAKGFSLEAVMDIEKAETKGRKARLIALFPRKEGPGFVDKGLVGHDPAFPEGEKFRKEVPPDAPARALAEGMFPKSMIDPPEFFPDRSLEVRFLSACSRHDKVPERAGNLCCRPEPEGIPAAPQGERDCRKKVQLLLRGHALARAAGGMKGRRTVATPDTGRRTIRFPSTRL